MFHSGQGHIIDFGRDAMPPNGSNVTICAYQVLDRVIVGRFGEANVVEFHHVLNDKELAQLFLEDTSVLLLLVDHMQFLFHIILEGSFVRRQDFAIASWTNQTLGIPLVLADQVSCVNFLDTLTHAERKINHFLMLLNLDFPAAPDDFPVFLFFSSTIWLDFSFPWRLW